MPPPPPAPDAPTVAELRRRLGALTMRDERRLRRRLDGLRRPRTGAPSDEAVRALAREIDEAERRCEARRQSVTSIAYPAELPVTERKDEILAAIREHQVVIVAGETGSGKSTQLPKICLELGRGVRGLIGHTQPRRLAARTVAERVAEELHGTVGDVVGYTVRFTDQVGEATRVKVMTDGILLAELQRDRSLLAYDTLIIDEAHERSLNVDFILGYLKQLLPRRPDLKVIITSATIDTERFAAHFDGAPVIEVSGRTYPVEVRYRPFAEEPDDDRDQIQAVCDAVEELRREGPGDVLVFLSGEREIHDTADALRRMDLPGTEVLPLYARLSAAEQHRIFEPHRGRRVVLATNVAETSLTVPGVRFVVDAGTARISRYSRRLKVQRLPIEAVSQASADQRAGRCGRVGPGTCIRLYSQESYDARPRFTEPEVLRTNLASVILQMTALGLGDVAAFPFVDPPDQRAVKDGMALLEELGALEPVRPGSPARLTPLGRKLAQLPLDPRLGRMVLEADRLGCAREVMVIAAALSIQDPRERPAASAAAAAEAHRRFAGDGSDFLAYLRLWEHLREQQKALSSNQFRKLCRAEFLNYLRVREWQDVYSQLRQLASSVGIRLGTGADAHPDRIHQALLSGLLSHLGMRDGQSQEFRGARQARFTIGSGSALAKRPPKWVMAAELVETNRLWARTVARVQPEWAERLGAHLVKRTYSEPRWDPDRGAAVATEKVTLYGLPIVTGRTVGYARVDPAAARDLFLWHALVEGDWHGRHAFVAANRQRIAEVRALEDRARRRDILVGDEAIFAFYDERVPAEVVSSRHFDQWWSRARVDDPHLLDLTTEVLVDPAAGPVDRDAFPDVWRQDDLELRLSYEFDPGSPTDGVTVHVPLAVLNRVRAEPFAWQVPGRREEVLVALIRALPKAVRRHLVPAVDHARAILARVGPDDGPLHDVAARELGRLAATPVDPTAWSTEPLPDHLRVTFAVEDEHGRRVAAGKDLDALRRRLHGHVRAAIASAAGGLERDDLQGWTIGTLPRVVASQRNGHTVTSHPALVDEGGRVAVRVLPDEAEQARAMRAGTRRLLLRTLPSPRKVLGPVVTNEVKLALAGLELHDVAALVEDCSTAAVDHLVAAHGGPAWDADGFAALEAGVRAGFTATLLDVGRSAGEVLVEAARVRRRLIEADGPALAPSVHDMRVQLARLVYPGFVTATGADRLRDLLRYVRAIGRRLDKLPSEPGRDRQRMAAVQELERERERLAARWAPGTAPAEVAATRWLVEELRVSVFAQALGTSRPVSEPRIRKELARLARAT